MVDDTASDDRPAEATRLAEPQPAEPLSEPPYGGTVLVVAPHPDDESVGPGGALALHAARGDRVHAVFVTSGVHGDPARRDDPQAYAAERRAEAEAAAAILGIAETEFWGLPDGCAVTSQDLGDVTDRLIDLLLRLEPDVIYAPHPGETHSDHYFAAQAVERAHRALGAEGHLLGYEVWSPQPAQWVLDVSDVYETKRRAVSAYPSQLAHTALLSAIEGLNTYRAILLPDAGPGGGRRAEVYRELS